MPEQVWINKPKETALRNHSEALEVPNSLVDGLGHKNGFHICPIIDATESGRDLPTGQNQASDDLVQ